MAIFRDTLGSCCNGPIYTSHHRLWRSLRIVDGVALCRMFHRVIRGTACQNTSAQTMIRCIDSISGKPIFGCSKWRRSSSPHVPLSHPFVERLRPQLRILDHTLFWTTPDLETKLFNFNSTITAIERMPDWTDACQNRLTDPHR